MKETTLNHLSREENPPDWLPLKRAGRKPLRPKDSLSRSEKGHEIWLLTLSDLLLLLAIFFVLLFGLTFQQQTQGFLSAGTQAQPPATREEPSSEAPPANAEESSSKGILTSLETDLRAILGSEKGMEEASVTRKANHLVLSFPEKIVFDPGQAHLKSGAKPVLDKVASLVSAYPYLHMEVQGHTDDRPIHTKRYPSNWELSVDRATQVVKALIGLGLDPAQISLKGFGEYRKLYPNDSDVNRQKNRRVEIQFFLSTQS
jgi:chemotaxis protein MotB